MEHPQEGSSSFSSLPHLFNQLEMILAEEYQSRHTPWIHITRIKAIIFQKHDIVLDVVAQNHGFGYDLKGFLKSSQRFAIYSTPASQEFYVARFQDTVPNYGQNCRKPIQYRVKRPWKVDRSLINMLENEGAERIDSKPYPKPSAYHPILPSRLFSIHDLELALTEILKCLTSHHPEKVTTISALSKKFYAHYRQPIRTTVRNICPEMMLVDVLKMMPAFHIQGEDDGEITIRSIHD
jgi:hypothetical protein